MIITPENALSKQQEAIRNAQNADASVDSPPPPYVPIEGIAVSETPNPDALPTNVKATNFIAVHQEHTTIRGVYVVDPRLKIPDSFLPLSTTDEPTERRNFQATSKNGCVTVTVHVIPDAKPFDGRKRVTLESMSKNGAVSAKIHRAGSSSPPFLLHASSTNGSISVAIPRSFHGLLTLSQKHGCVKLSNEVRARVDAVDITDHCHRYFIGSGSLNGGLDLRDDDMKDEVVAEGKNGAIKVTYNDEVSESVLKGLTGMFSRLF